MFYQVFLSPQVKRWAIITYKDGIYDLSHEFPAVALLYTKTRVCLKYPATDCSPPKRVTAPRNTLSHGDIRLNHRLARCLHAAPKNDFSLEK